MAEKRFIREIKVIAWRVIRFFTRDIWNLDLKQFSKFRARIIKHLKIAIITLKHFSSDKLGQMAVALSYFSTLAFVPLIAVIFAITNGFGFEKELESLIYKNFSSSHEIVEKVLGFAYNIIETTQKGIYGIISFLVFFWLVIWLMLNVEKAFNTIWKVEKSRRISKRIIAYFSIIIFSPFLMALFLATPLAVSDALNIFHLGESFKVLSSFLTWVILYFIIVFLFAAMYKYIPNAKVPFREAFNASVLSSLAFIIVQYIYMETQLFVSRLNGIYGIFAAIPLFMVWINFAWFIILFGSELSYAFKFVDTYEK